MQTNYNSINFGIQEVPCEVLLNNEWVSVPNKKVLVRDDNHTSLGVVGDNYRVVPHTEVLDAVDASLQKKLTAEWNRTIRTERNGALMRATYVFPRIKFDVNPAVGDIVQFGFDIINSLDGSTSVSLAIFLTRLVCTNGMTSNMKSFRLTSSHTQQFSVDKFQTASIEAYKLTGSQLVPKYRNMLAMRVSDTEKLIEDSPIPKKYREYVGDSFKEWGDSSMWGLYNAFTYVLTHILNNGEEKTERTRLLSRQVDVYFDGLIA